MKKFIVIVALLFAGGTAALQFSTAYKAQTDLGELVERQLGFVDDASLKTVARAVVREAEKLGIKLTPNDVRVLYRDSDRQTIAQKYVSQPLHTQFLNKEAVIEVRYTARVLGFPVKQEVTRSRLHQQRVIRPDPNGQLNQVLDGVQ
jgi:hypothetical protein